MSVIHADCLDAMAAMDADSVDAIVSDPPYGLSFMGKQWDHGVPGVPFWTEALRVAKPGAHLVAFGGTRTFHRLACAIEDAGWEVRDCLSWNFGSGFPKSHNIDKTGVSCACDDDLPGMRPRVLSPTVTHQEVQSSVLFAEVQRDGKGEGVGKPRSQGPCGVDSGLHGIVPVQNARPIESGMEGRRHLEAPEGELLGRPVRPSAGMGAADGAEGRLHIGASVGHGAEGAAIARPDGSGASPEPRPIGQSTGEPGTLADERITQAGGVWPTCDGCGKPRIARGLGTALKPAWEPIILARKPLTGTVAANVTQYGTGAINVDGCRIGTADSLGRPYGGGNAVYGKFKMENGTRTGDELSGRWPANVCLDEDAAAMLDAQSGERGGGSRSIRVVETDEGRDDESQYRIKPTIGTIRDHGDTGGASRFFYTAKASRREREAGLEGMPERDKSSHYGEGLNSATKVRTDEQAEAGVDRGSARNHHPTVKPIALMRWLCRLVTPPNGLVLDPFTGSGTTGCAAVLEGFRFVGVEREAEYVAIAEKRIAHWAGQRTVPEPDLFGDAA